MKKSIATLLAMLMLLSLMAGCASTPASTPTDEPAVTEPSAETPAEEPSEEPAEEPAQEPTEEPAEEQAPAEETVSIYPLCEPGEITLTWYMPKSSNVLALCESDNSQNLFYQHLEEVTGVHIEWTLFETNTFREQFPLVLVSEEYPDLAEISPSYCASSSDAAYEEEILYRLNDFWDLLPNYRAAVERSTGGLAAITTDGGNVMIFQQLRDREQPSFLGYYIRDDWRNNLGLELPVTLDDWHDTLVAFRDNGYGVLGVPSTGIPTSDFIVTAFDISLTSPYLIQRDGVVASTIIDNNYREYLETMSSWYSEKLIYHDFASLNDRDYNAAYVLIEDEEVGIYADMFRNGATYLHDTLNIGGDDFYAQKLTRPVKTEGVPNKVGNRNTFGGGVGEMGVVMFTSCQYPEIACQMMDYIYSPEGELHANWGFEGVTFEYDEEGNPQYLPMIAENVSTNRDVYLIQSRPKMDLMDCIEWGLSEEALSYYELWDDVGEWNMPVLTYTTEEGEERSAIMNDCTTYFTEFNAKVIAGQITINDTTWNDYVAALKDMGIDRWIEIEQQAFDRYLAR